MREERRDTEAYREKEELWSLKRPSLRRTGPIWASLCLCVSVSVCVCVCTCIRGCVHLTIMHFSISGSMSSYMSMCVRELLLVLLHTDCVPIQPHTLHS